MKLTDCAIQGHNLVKDDNYISITDHKNVTHMETKCTRCGQRVTVHLDNNKTL